MTAGPYEPAPDRSGRPHAGPRAIRAALPIGDREAFDADFRAAMATATEEQDLAPVTACLERWWRVAWSAADLRRHREMLDHTNRLLAGEDVPTVPWSELRARLGL